MFCFNVIKSSPSEFATSFSHVSLEQPSKWKRKMESNSFLEKEATLYNGLHPRPFRDGVTVWDLITHESGLTCLAERSLGPADCHWMQGSIYIYISKPAFYWANMSCPLVPFKWIFYRLWPMPLSGLTLWILHMLWETSLRAKPTQINLDVSKSVIFTV